MIKVLQLIFEPTMTWEKIAQAKWRARSVFLLYLLPLLLLTLAAELAGMSRWGKAGEYLGRPTEFGGRLKVSDHILILYGAAQFLASLWLVAYGAVLVRKLTHTFNNRQTYTQCFTVTAYALGPLFLLRLCDAAPSMNPWVSFAIGIVLTVAILYHGIPWVLEPDPPHAFGLYLCSSLLLACLSGIARYLTLLLLAQNFRF
jgi:hypothetical protein